jgi:hypothetical protein
MGDLLLNYPSFLAYTQPEGVYYIMPIGGSLAIMTSHATRYTIGADEKLEVDFTFKDGLATHRNVRIIVEPSVPDKPHKDCDPAWCKDKEATHNV